MCITTVSKIIPSMFEVPMLQDTSDTSIVRYCIGELASWIDMRSPAVYGKIQKGVAIHTLQKGGGVADILVVYRYMYM